MSFVQKLIGWASGNGVEVSTNNELRVVNDTARSTIRAFFENDPGAITGTVLQRSPEVSRDYRVRTGRDTVLFNDTFNATSQNTANWKHAFVTMTMTQSSGFLNVNAAGTSTVSGNYATLQTWRYFPLIGTAPLAKEFVFQITATPIANEVVLFGQGIANTSNEPIDGVWLELTSAGLKGCLRYNSGTVAKVTLISDVATIALNSNMKAVIVTDMRGIEFWIDEVLYGELDLPNAQGQPFLTTALPLFIAKYNSNTVGSSPNVIAKFGEVTLSVLDIDLLIPYPHQAAGMGLSGQGLNGGTMAGNSFVTNNTNPTTALPVNTALTANLPNALGGGIGLATLWNLAATDMVMTQATNPAGSVNQTPRTMMVTRVRIFAAAATAAWSAPAAGQHLLMWGVYYGSTAVTLAQAESASFTNNTVKAFRRRVVGLMGWATGAAPVGTPADREIVVEFEAPLAVNPGENIGLFCRMLNGAATATGGLYYTYHFDHYFI